MNRNGDPAEATALAVGSELYRFGLTDVVADELYNLRRKTNEMKNVSVCTFHRVIFHVGGPLYVRDKHTKVHPLNCPKSINTNPCAL